MDLDVYLIFLYLAEIIVESFGSCPAIIFKILTQSSTFLVKIPGTSMEFTSGINPEREINPYVGFKPIIPQ